MTPLLIILGGIVLVAIVGIIVAYIDDHPKDNKRSSMSNIEITRIAQNHLGMPGAMLVRSKADRNATTICNAGVFNSEGEMVWSGDLDVKKSKVALLELEKELGDLFVLYESDGFRLEKKPVIHYLKSKAEVVIQAGNVFFSEHFTEWMKSWGNRKKR